MRAGRRQGFGWKRWSKHWLYEKLGLFNNYRVKGEKTALKVLPAG
jgi:RNA-directed DNA polymerase